jgi:hypothetical protein
LGEEMEMRSKRGRKCLRKSKQVWEALMEAKSMRVEASWRAQASSEAHILAGTWLRAQTVEEEGLSLRAHLCG